MHAHSTVASKTADSEPANGLVLERLPNGELAWLRRELDAAIRAAERLDRDVTRLLERRHGHQPAPERRYGLTQQGRDYLARERAMEALFGPSPTVAQACAAEASAA